MGKRYACVRRHSEGEFEYCEECFRKQQLIDKLKTENEYLKAQLRYRKNKKEFSSIFGSSTPSSKLEFKVNSDESDQKKQGGAPVGRQGYGRKQFDKNEADEIHALRVEKANCRECGGKLESLRIEKRCVIDALLTEAKKLLYECQVKQCQNCKKQVSRKPLVQPGFMYGNNLISNAIVDHYATGIPIRKIAQTLGKGVSSGALIRIFHYLSKKWEPSIEKLESEYRQSPVRHADETGWRTDGKNGYAWLFCTPSMSLFKFGKTRAAETPQAVLGSAPLKGTLVVDRYAGYNKMPCHIQYCYAHLLRDLQDVEAKFPDNQEVKTFVADLAPLFSKAMKLRGEPILDPDYYIQAKDIRKKMLALSRAPAKFLAIQTFQNLILDNRARLFRWVSDRRVPAENNRAERELRPTVIARKMSFGSQSQKGAHTRSVLMSILHTAAKRLDTLSLREWFRDTLNELARNPHIDLFSLLPKS